MWIGIWSPLVVDLRVGIDDRLAEAVARNLPQHIASQSLGAKFPLSRPKSAFGRARPAGGSPRTTFLVGIAAGVLHVGWAAG